MNSPPHNLPHQPTSFVGRDEELQELHQLFAKTRFLTLTGVGGTGKTRLALQYAAEKRNDYPDGVWLVDLAPLTDPELVPRAFAGVFGLREEPGADLADLIVQHLQDKRLLLVIDNCEHLIKQTVRQAESLLTNCPGVKLLVTSRESLRVEQETSYTVPSLQTPESDSLKTIACSPAVRLFVDRARSVCGSFDLDEENAAAIAAVCRRLDGIPLAIELAAACTRTMTPQDVLLWLNRRFKLLTGGAKTAIKRQQTLRSLIDWSYDLLDESEKTLFDAVSVFRGGWTLEAAEKVCTVADIDDVDVLDLLSSLVHKSLVVVESDRYRMLETVRDYAADRLAESGDALVVRDRHAGAFLEFAELAGPRLTGPEQIEWLDRVETENDNVRTALAWMAADPDYSEQALRLCAAVWRFWASRGHLSEGRRWIDDALECDKGQRFPDLRAQVLNGTGYLAWLQADYDDAQARIGEALPLLRSAGAKKGLADALNLLGNVTTALGDNPKARALYGESLEIRREIKDTGGIAGSLNDLGSLAIEAGDTVEARRLLEECLAIYRKIGDKNSAALSLKNLGTVAEHEGDYKQARALFVRSLESFREIGDRQRTAAAIAHVGTVAVKQGDFQTARTMFEQSLEIRQEIGDQRGHADSLLDLGNVDIWESDLETAQKRIEKSLARRRALGDQWGIASSMYYLGVTALLRNEFERAIALLEESLEIRDRLEDRRGSVYTALWLGNAALAIGDANSAHGRFENVLRVFQEIKDRAGAAQALEGFGRLYCDSDPERAVKLSAAAATERSRIGSIRPPHERAAVEECLARAKSALGCGQYDAAWREGKTMPFDEAVRDALQKHPAVAAQG